MRHQISAHANPDNSNPKSILANFIRETDWSGKLREVTLMFLILYGVTLRIQT